jgi:hypothetical protein
VPDHDLDATPPTHLLQGDQLIATSGVTYTKEADYGGAPVKMGQEMVRLQVPGEVRATQQQTNLDHNMHA